MAPLETIQLLKNIRYNSWLSTKYLIARYFETIFKYYAKYVNISGSSKYCQRIKESCSFTEGCLIETIIC